MDEDMLNTYVSFVLERHLIWKRRHRGTGEWKTYDRVLASRKFCNVYRVLDYGSQYVCKELLYGADSILLGPEDVLFRAMAYRYTNRPEPWEWFRGQVGRYPLAADAQSGLVLEVWREWDRRHGVFFSSAYTMFSGGENPGVRRFEWALGLATDSIALAPRLFAEPDAQARCDLLKTLPRVGDFMAQQVLTDINYSPFHVGTENDWVTSGPGSLRGHALLTPEHELSFEQVVNRCQSVLRDRLGKTIALQMGGGALRYPSKMDVQNTLCEFDKYIRWKAKPTPRKPYRPAHPGRPAEPFLPPHWLQEN